MSKLPGSWVKTKLFEVVDVHDDLREPVNANERSKRPGPYPYYGATGQVGWIDGYRQDGEYVLLGEDGAPFFDLAQPKAYLVTGKCWVNNHAHVLRGRDGVCQNRFLLHALNHADYRGYANGTTRLKLTQGAMRDLPIRLAPFNEQQRVVEKLEELLSDLDAGVLALERAHANLKRYRAAVLKAAVEGRLTEKWRAAHPDVEPAEKLLERILAERRRKWEEMQLKKYAEKGQAPPKGWRDRYPEPVEPDVAALPELPKGWCWAALEQLVERSEYGTSVKCSYDAHHEPVLRIPNIAGGRIDLTDMKRSTMPLGLTAEDALQPSDLLVCRTNGSIKLVGKAALIEMALAPLHSFASYLLRLRFLEAMEVPRWIWLFLTSEPGRRFIEAHAASSAGQHNVSLSLLHGMPVPLAPIEEQRAANAEVDQQLSVQVTASQDIELQLLHSGVLRQLILKRAFEGKLVPQDPNDEPASELLARIRAGTANTGAAGRKRHRGRDSQEHQQGAA